MQLPRITVITPSYNHADFIQETIDSVLGQNYPDLEYIVMDGGSTDGTVEILKSYGDQINWVSEKDEGQSDAINKGLRMAAGEVVAFLNSDDLYAPGALLQVGNYFSAHPDTMWVTGKCRTVDTKGKEINKLVTLYKNFWLWMRSKSILYVLNYISQPSTFWKREALDEIGYLNQELFYTMDYDYWLRLIQKYSPGILPAYLSEFRLYPASKSGGSVTDQFVEELQVAKRNTASRLLIFLHGLHNKFIALIYAGLRGV